MTTRPPTIDSASSLVGGDWCGVTPRCRRVLHFSPAPMLQSVILSCAPSPLTLIRPTRCKLEKCTGGAPLEIVTSNGSTDCAERMMVLSPLPTSQTCEPEKRAVCQ
eukprot:1314944-Prymnesium_polylepis.1